MATAADMSGRDAGSGDGATAGTELLDCDLVMRGGLTSGLVYPGTLAVLATRYRFRCIGGASAGAIAAGVAAAAEVGRRGPNAPFPTVFSNLVARLADDLGGMVDGETRLKTLFHPAEPVRALFEIGWAKLDGEEIEGRLLSLVGRLARPTLSRAGLLAIAIGLAGALFGGLGAAAMAAAGAGPFAIAVALMLLGAASLVAALLPFWTARRRILADLSPPFRAMAENGFGLCPGVNPAVDPQSTDAMARHGGFADWMHATIQRAAGRSVTDRPVTVADLWGTRDPWAPDRAVDLLLTTTNLTQQLPHQFPFLERSSSFLYFTPQALAGVLPARVIAHLVETRNPEFDIVADGVTYHRLPRAPDLPVLLGVRLSMSFPFLISAVKLFECPAWEPKAPDAAQPRPSPCWFSDGGITSNFPVASFDSPLPARPTFCINLADLPPGEPAEAERVRMASSNTDGIRAPLRSDLADGSFATFLGAIVDAARNGRENEQMTLPSQRDRIVTVLLDPRSEGGLHLNMDEEALKRLAGYGRAAGLKLIQRFHPEGGGDREAPAMTWANHRWGRIRTSFAGLEALALRVAAGWARADAEGRTVADMFAAADQKGTSYPFGSAAALRRASQAAGRIAEEAARLRDAATPRPDTSVFDGERRGPTRRGREDGAPRPTLRFQLGPVGLDPRRS